MSKKNPHADMMPHVEFKFNISVQVIVHKLIYGIVLILSAVQSKFWYIGANFSQVLRGLSAVQSKFWYIGANFSQVLRGNFLMRGCWGCGTLKAPKL